MVDAPHLTLTEQGVAMLSSGLRSRRAIAVNVEIMRAFVRLREMIGEYAQLRRRIDELEQRTDGPMPDKIIRPLLHNVIRKMLHQHAEVRQLADSLPSLVIPSLRGISSSPSGVSQRFLASSE